MVSKDEKDTQELIGKANFEGYPAAAMKENIQKPLPTYTKKSCKNHQTYLQNPPQRHPKWLFGPLGALLGSPDWPRFPNLSQNGAPRVPQRGPFGSPWAPKNVENT